MTEGFANLMTSGSVTKNRIPLYIFASLAEILAGETQLTFKGEAPLPPPPKPSSDPGANPGFNPGFPGFSPGGSPGFSPGFGSPGPGFPP
jgi:hypothetical protein